MVLKRKPKKKPTGRAGGSITDKVRKRTGIGGETGEQKRSRFLKSQERDPYATGKEAEDQLRRSKGLKPNKEEEPKKETKAPLPQEGQPLEEKKAGPTGLISERPLTPEEESLREPLITDQPEVIQSFQNTLLSFAATGVSPGAVKSVGGLIGGLGKRILNLSTTAKIVLGTAATTLSGLSGMFTWMANDNMAGGMEFFTKGVRDAVQFGDMSVSDGVALMDEAQGTVDAARDFTNTQTIINPTLWPFRNLINANMDKAQRVIDFNRAIIQGTAVVTPEEVSPQEIPIPEETESV